MGEIVTEQFQALILHAKSFAFFVAFTGVFVAHALANAIEAIFRFWQERRSGKDKPPSGGPGSQGCT